MTVELTSLEVSRGPDVVKVVHADDINDGTHHVPSVLQSKNDYCNTNSLIIVIRSNLLLNSTVCYILICPPQCPVAVSVNEQ